MLRLPPDFRLAPTAFVAVLLWCQFAEAERPATAEASSTQEASQQAADAPAGGADAGIDFASDIRPILSENCFFCHGPDENQRQAGLRLDTEAGASAVIQPGGREFSELMSRLTTDDPFLKMPPPDSNRELTAEQIERIGRWIDAGARWQQHWSFRPIERPPVPELSESDVPVRNPIDAFVQHRLQQEEGLEPSPEADRRTLIRRLSLDLTGLPPAPADVEAFVASDDPQAYEKLVDRLLDSPAYGERMAWEWLDAARYADTNGYQGDRERTMWPWRDWVVDAFNENMPFDQFTVWQVAGDLLPEATDEQRLATGFHRNHMINGEGGRIAEENRVEYVLDMTETVGTVWLGLTLNCCRCHDHKYDPLTNREYYQLTAFFNQTPVTGAGGDPQTKPNLAVPSDAQQTRLEQLNRQLAALDDQIQSEASPSDQQAEQRETLAQQKQNLQREIPRVMVMRDMDQRRTTYLLERGLYNQRGEEVEAGVPEVFPGLAASAASQADGPPDRLDLARWLVSDENPLTARVTVNRFWQQVFGTGLVNTPEDFGVQGEIPPHQDLLNWLAAEFRDSGWDVKRLMRLIVTSHTYRQVSTAGAELWQRDPENRLLARASRYRMPSWMIRDAALAAAGLLSPARGGAGVNSYQPEGVWADATFGKKTYQRDQGEPLYRRSLYLFWRRIVAPTIFFDNASRQTCTVNDTRTNTPLHALRTLNDVTFVEAARVLAGRVLASGAEGDPQRLRRVFARVLARPPSASQAEILLAGLENTRRRFDGAPNQARRLLATGEMPRRESLDAVEHASWTALCLAVLNLDETLNRE